MWRSFQLAESVLTPGVSSVHTNTHIDTYKHTHTHTHTHTHKTHVVYHASMYVQCCVLCTECISDYQVDEPAAALERGSTLFTEEEDSTDTEMLPSQPANPMITTWSMHTQCTDTDRKTYVISVTLPAIQKRKKVEPPIPK